MAELVVLASILGAILDEVIGPDMIAVLRPQPDARSVGEPELVAPFSWVQLLLTSKHVRLELVRGLGGV
jgi:hypothetical protein